MKGGEGSDYPLRLIFPTVKIYSFRGGVEFND